MIQNIFLLDGLGGTGKSDFVQYVTKKYQGNPQRGAVIKKITTRPERDEERKRKPVLDLKFVTPATFASHRRKGALYTYDVGGYLYGFHKEDIQRRINTGVKNVFIIVKDRDVHRRLAHDFPQCRVVRVYIYSDIAQIRDRLSSDGYDQSHIDHRLNRVGESWFDYLEQSALYDEIIVNNSDKATFHRIIENLIRKYDGYPPELFCVDNRHQYPLLPSLVGHKEEMVKRIVAFPFEKNVFLMMKFRPGTNALHQQIKRALKALGLNCVRADDREWDITKNVYNPVAVLYCCKYGIALFDKAEPGNTFSPNVAYELGIMHLQRKNCLILNHKDLPGPPFDLVKDLYRGYSSDDDAIAAVESWIGKLLTDG